MTYRRFAYLLFLPCRSPDDAGGAPGAGGSPPAAGAGDGMRAPGATGSPLGGGSPPAGEGAPAAWKLPDGLPEHLRADKPEEFAAKIHEDWTKQRTNAQQLAEKYKVPEKADDYKFEPSEKVKPFVGDMSKDPVFGLMREQALKAGIPAPMFNSVLGGLYENMVDKGMIPKPYDPVSEVKTFLGDEAKFMTPQQMGEKITPIVDAAHGWIDGLVTNKVIGDQESANVLRAMADSAVGLRTLVALQQMVKTPGVQLGGNGAPGGVTHADLKARLADPRYDQNSAQFSRQFRDDVDAQYKQLFK